MRELIERKISAKEEQINKLSLEVQDLIHKLQKLTFDEYEIEDYVINTAMLIKANKKEIQKLHYEVYELMQILKAE